LDAVHQLPIVYFSKIRNKQNKRTQTITDNRISQMKQDENVHKIHEHYIKMKPKVFMDRATRTRPDFWKHTIGCAELTNKGQVVKLLCKTVFIAHFNPVKMFALKAPINN